jgi:60Kd inner membrane protein
MQMMGKVMPLLLGVFSLNLPTGVSIYWVASNVWTIVQQQFMLKNAPAPIGAATGTGAAKPAPAAAKKGGLAALLQAQSAKSTGKGRPEATSSPAKWSDGAAKRQPAKDGAGGEKGVGKPGGRERGAQRQAPAKASPTVEANAKGDGDGAVSGNGEAPEEVAQKAAPARGNGKGGPPKPGRPAPSGASSRPRNSSAKKRRRR